MKQGAFNYLHKPLDLKELREVVADALNVARCMRQPAVLSETLEDGAEEADAFLGGSPAMLEACKAIGRVSGKDVPVLITGESGTGKELAARAVYQHSSRAMAHILLRTKL